MPFSVFVNYRFGDEENTAALLASVLQDRFGADRVFLASGSIRPSELYADRLLEAARGASVLVAVVGPRWLTVVDGSGRKRIRSEGDWVRREIAEALASRVPVVPVLVGTTQPLPAEELPDDIKPIAGAQYLRLRYRDVRSDLGRLVDELGALVPDLAGTGGGDTAKSGINVSNSIRMVGSTGSVTAVEVDDLEGVPSVTVWDTIDTVDGTYRGFVKGPLRDPP